MSAIANGSFVLCCASEGYSKTEPILSAGGRAMDQSNTILVGIDVSKVRNAVAIAEGRGNGEVRYLGEVREHAKADQTDYVEAEGAHFCYEAGSTGYGLYRLIVGIGFPCAVVAPSLIPTKAE